jgi:plasmid stabilization system protein ParE
VDWEVVWTEPAFADLEAAVRYAARYGSNAADALRADLLGSVEVLARFPLIGPAHAPDRTGSIESSTVSASPNDGWKT